MKCFKHFASNIPSDQEVQDMAKRICTKTGDDGNESKKWLQKGLRQRKGYMKAWGGEIVAWWAGVEK